MEIRIKTSAEKIEAIRQAAQSKVGRRLVGQLRYALLYGQEFQDKEVLHLVAEVADGAYKALLETGYLSDETAQKSEEKLCAMAEKAKRLVMTCVAHAHIDVNWQWDYPETVASTLSTFQTMIHLLNEYPSFRFAQSQIALYEICRQYDPELFQKIKQRVAEGRWEVAASFWVESDKNMPSGESLLRHMLYSKQYAKEHFGLEPESLSLDFEPDTFGHSANLPEILQAGGIKYYYHCRGAEGPCISRWQGQSGAELLRYREPNWYNAEIDEDMVLYVPKFCREHGVSETLKVYGVGNHGGGPSRRDIERLQDMASWPVFPKIEFGTYGAFFQRLEQQREQFPVVSGELNMVFPGCYTTQTRIKRENRQGEAKLYESETYQAMDAALGGRKGQNLKTSWQQLLTQQFHDVLTGSCVRSAREYAMGEYQRVQARANACASAALGHLSGQIDTASLRVEEECIEETTSRGAGVGFGVPDYCLPQTERGEGRQRVYHVFNSLPRKSSAVGSLILWDWPGDTGRISLTTPDGSAVPFQVLEKDDNGLWENWYWWHSYKRILFWAEVPACGYITLLLDENPLETVDVFAFREPRVEQPVQYILENDFLRAEFDEMTAQLLHLTDKKTGRSGMGDGTRGGFHLIREDDARGMTAWVVGRHMSHESLHHGVKITEFVKGDLRSWLRYRIAFGQSSLDVTVMLEKESRALDFHVDCDWQEVAQKGSFIPQLSYACPLPFSCQEYVYDIPCGLVKREEKNHNVPANSFIAAFDGAFGVALSSVGSYGFRGVEDTLNLTLVRSSYDPDPYPEQGMNRFRFFVGMAQEAEELLHRSAEALCPLSVVSGQFQEGTLPTSASLVEAAGAEISAIKEAEQGDGLLVRLYGTADAKEMVQLRFAKPVRTACFTDLYERRLGDDGIQISGTNLSVPMRSKSIVSILIHLEE